jgi:HSP20 family protein
MLARMMSDFAPLLRLHDDVNRMFESFFEDVPVSRPYSATYPALNTWEDADAAYVEAELPGLTIDDVEITVAGNELSIAGQRRIGDNQQEHEGANWHRRERGQGQFTRTIGLPWDIDADKVEARLTDGVLTVKLPKAEQARAKKVKVLS